MPRLPPTPLPEDPLLTTPQEFGAAIRAARSAAKLSIAEAALQLGIAKQTLSNLENAQGGVGIDIALHAAAELGVALFVVPAGQREPVRRAIKAVKAELAAVPVPRGPASLDAAKSSRR